MFVRNILSYFFNMEQKLFSLVANLNLLQLVSPILAYTEENASRSLKLMIVTDANAFQDTMGKNAKVNETIRFTSSS